MTKAESYKWNVIGINPKIVWIAVDKLKIDHTYQRENIRDTKVLTIARDFDWAAFGSINVMEREGQFFVTDGQHRLAAAIRRGDIPKVPCVMNQSTGVVSEAKAFVESNTNRRAVSAYDKYRAMLATGNPLHVAAQAMLDKYGLIVKQERPVNTLSWPELLIRTFKIDAEMCEKCILLQRQAIGQDIKLNHLPHKGFFHIATHIQSGNIFEHGERIYHAGGLACMIHAIRQVQIESGKEGVSDAIAARGILLIVNRNLKSHKVTI